MIGFNTGRFQVSLLHSCHQWFHSSAARSSPLLVDCISYLSMQINSSLVSVVELFILHTHTLLARLTREWMSAADFSTRSTHARTWLCFLLWFLLSALHPGLPSTDCSMVLLHSLLYIKVRYDGSVHEISNTLPVFVACLCRRGALLLPSFLPSFLRRKGFQLNGSCEGLPRSPIINRFRCRGE